MGKLKTASDERESFIKMGIWFIDNHAVQYNGTLHYETVHPAKLDILGLPKCQSPKAIWGMCEGGNVLSAFDAIHMGFHGNPFSPDSCISTYLFSDFWVGPHALKSKSKARFRQVSFGINGLDGWYNCHAFNLIQKDMKEITAEYKRPDHVELYEDEFVKIKIGFDVSTSGVSVVQNSVSIEHAPRIIVESQHKRKMPFFGCGRTLSDYMKFAHTFIGILIGTDAFDYDYKCVEEFIKFDRQRKPKSIGCEFAYYQSKDIPKKAPNNSMSVIVPFSQVEFVRNAMKKFSQIYFCERETFQRLLYYTYSWKPMDDYSLPQTTFLFERISKMLLHEETISEKKSRVVKSGDWKIIEQLKNIQEIADSKKLSSMVDRLYNPDPSLKDITNVVLRRTQHIFPFIKGAHNSKRRKKLITYISDRRNSGAHAGGKIPNADLDYWCTRFLMLELLIILLMYCGVDNATIKRYIQRPFTGYFHMAKHLPLLLRRI